MRKEMRIFALAIISTVVFMSVLGIASSKPIGDATVTYGVTWNPLYVPSPTGGQVNVVVNNTGGIAIAKFALAISGGTVTSFYTQSMWSTVVVGNSVTWQATSGKAVIGKGGYNVFQFDWTGPYSPGFTGSWTVYDRKGNTVDSGSFSWHNP
jgi:hypothetical protein